MRTILILSSLLLSFSALAGRLSPCTIRGESDFEFAMRTKKEVIAEKFLTGIYKLPAENLLAVEYRHRDNKPLFKHKAKEFTFGTIAGIIIPVFVVMDEIMGVPEGARIIDGQKSECLDVSRIGRGTLELEFRNESQQVCTLEVSVQGGFDYFGWHRNEDGSRKMSYPKTVEYNLKLKGMKKSYQCE